jgi:hypothetical protein
VLEVDVAAAGSTHATTFGPAPPSTRPSRSAATGAALRLDDQLAARHRPEHRVEDRSSSIDQLVGRVR